MSNNYQNNYFPDDSDPAGQAEYFELRPMRNHQNNSFFDQNFDHSAAKILELIQYISERLGIYSC